MAGLLDLIGNYLGVGGSVEGPARGSPGGLPTQARDAPNLMLTRERIQRELEDSLRLRQAFDRNTTAEVGTGADSRRMYQAATIDRAVQSGRSLFDTLNDPYNPRTGTGYYPPPTMNAFARGRGAGFDVDPAAFEGVNFANYATGNSSYDPKTGRHVGFAGGPQTGSSPNGERYGIEGPAGLAYARAVGYTGPDRTPIGPMGPMGGGPVGGVMQASLDAEPSGIPIRATPTQGQRPMAGLLGGLPQGQQSGGILGNLGQGIDTNRNAILGYLAGALQGGNLGQSIGRGLGGMVEGSQIDTKQAGIGATEQALAQSGMNPAFASAIAKNPHALAAWQALNPELKIQTVADSWGNQSVIGVNPRSGVGSPITIGQPGAASGTPGAPVMKGGPEASIGGAPSAAQAATQIQNALAAGESDPVKLTQFIPDTGTAAYTRALLRGDALPSNLGNRAGAVRANAIQFAHIIDPNFREEQITERQAFAKNMSSAAPNSFGSQVRGSGTVVKHIGSGLDNLAVITKGANGVPLGMGEYGEQPELNAVRAAANRRANDQEYNKAYGGYRLDADAVAGEVVRLLTGGQGSEKDRKQWQDKFDISKNSLSEVRGAWNEAYTIMHGRLSEVAQQKSRAYNMEVDPFSLLSPGSEKIAAKVRTLGAAPGTEGAPATSAPVAPTAPTVPAGVIKWERGPDGKPRPMVQQ